jgi:CheY-like chemotaxis protein
MTTREELAPPIDVLIAEDDDATRHGLRALLEGQGYTCVEAADGREAVTLARRRPPRCVLLDLTLPGLDGLAVARRLRADPRTRAAHIHAVTGRDDPAAQEAARRAGCEAFLTKPVEPEAILGLVRPSAPGGTPAAAPAEWLTGLTLAEARDLLDWLENNGCAGLEASFGTGGEVAVRCVCPPGLRLGRDGEGRPALLRAPPRAGQER